MALTIEQARKLLSKGEKGDSRSLANVIRALLDGDIELNELTQAELLVLLAAILPGNGRILYDNNGAIGGSAAITADPSVGLIKSTQHDLSNDGTFISAPAADHITYRPIKYSRAWPAFLTEDKLKPLIQPLIGSSWRKWLVQPFSNSGGSGVSTIGGAFTAVDNFVYRAPASTNWATRNDRVGFQALAAAGSATRLGCSTATVRRSATAGVGGFRAELIFKLATNAAGFQFFAGVVPSGSLTPGGDPSAQTDCFGIGFDAADAIGSNFFVMHNDAAGTCTRVATGKVRDTTSAWRLILDCSTGNASTLYWHLTNMNDGTAASGTITTDLPTADAALSALITYRNGAIASRPEFDLYTAAKDWPLN